MQMQLFGQPPPILISPGDAQRLAARRAANRAAQRRCRARRLWRANIAKAPLDQTIRLSRAARELAIRMSQMSDDQEDQINLAKFVLMSALINGGESGAVAARIVEPHAIFDNRLALVWGAICALNARRALISARTVERELARKRLSLIMNLKWLDDKSQFERPEIGEVESANALLCAITQPPAEKRAAA